MMSLAFTLVSAVFLLGAPEVHLAPFDAPMEAGEGSDSRRIALAAAANEQESFYLRVVNDETPRVFEGLDLDLAAPMEPILHVYRLEGGGALSPFSDPIPLHEGDELDLLVSLSVPEFAKPGAYSAVLRVNFESGKAERCSVQLEVFDFILPDESSLPVIFGVDRGAINKATGKTEALDDWALFYDALAALRVGFAVWPEREYPDEIFYDYRDLDFIKEHLAYAVRTAHLPAIEIGGKPGDLLAGWPPPVGNAPQDPLQLLLFNLTTSLHQLGWAKPTVLIPGPLPERKGWPETRQALARINRADEIVARLLPGPLHPYFERYTDLWALPATTPPSAMSLLQAGLSTIRYGHPAYREITGSPGMLDESHTYATEPGDALDGCEYTAWRVDTEANGGPAVLALDFEVPIRLETMAVLWPFGARRATIKVETALNPGVFSEATVRWTRSNSLSEGESDISLGDVKYPRECRQIRILFTPEEGATTSVAEVLINQDGRTVINRSIDAVQPWLNLRTGQNPWLDTRVAGSAWRLLPWFTWQRNFQGILGPELTPEPQGTQLIAPGPEGIYPTLALFHLLDGLEDYEYLRHYWRAVSQGRIKAPAHHQPGRLALPVSLREGAQVSETLDHLKEDRIRMGKLLSGQALVTTNFGP